MEAVVKGYTTYRRKMMGMFDCSIPEQVVENSGNIFFCKKEQGQRSSLLKDVVYSFCMQATE
jgi:hypothetical protein